MLSSSLCGHTVDSMIGCVIACCDNICMLWQLVMCSRISELAVQEPGTHPLEPWGDLGMLTCTACRVSARSGSPTWTACWRATLPARTLTWPSPWPSESWLCAYALLQQVAVSCWHQPCQQTMLLAPAYCNKSLVFCKKSCAFYQAGQWPDLAGAQAYRKSITPVQNDLG